MASVRVEFRTSSHGTVVATYTTTNTSQTEVIQTGLQCAINYYITVIVTGATSDGQHFTLSSRAVRVLIRGKEIVYMGLIITLLMVVLPLHRYTHTIYGVRAEVIADNTSIRVSWQWSPQGLPLCVDFVRVHYIFMVQIVNMLALLPGTKPCPKSMV